MQTIIKGKSIEANGPARNIANIALFPALLFILSVRKILAEKNFEIKGIPALDNMDFDVM